MTQDRFRRRALIVLANAQQDLGENREALATASLVIAQWPGHPGALLARLERAECAYLLGDLDTAAADGAAYLAYPDRKPLSVAFVHFVLANQAFRDGDNATAQSEFTLLLGLPQNDDYLGPAHHGLAQALQAQGDLKDAVVEEVKAADSPVRPGLKPLYLYSGVLTARALGDRRDGRRAHRRAWWRNARAASSPVNWSGTTCCRRRQYRRGELKWESIFLVAWHVSPR